MCSGMSGRSASLGAVRPVRVAPSHRLLPHQLLHAVLPTRCHLLGRLLDQPGGDGRQDRPGYVGRVAMGRWAGSPRIGVQGRPG